MKAAPFSYVRPTLLNDVIDELNTDQSGSFAKVIAGGQSLMPVLAMRLARPSLLVDITAVDELKQLSVENGELRVGAAVRQRQVEQEASTLVPLLGSALPWVGHREIRSRGTLCGSLAHADPSAELPAVAQCLGATIEVVGTKGRREVPAKEFFTGAMSTVVDNDELVYAVKFPLPRPGEGFGFAEVARRQGDFALVGVAVRIRTRDKDVEEAVITAFGVADRPHTRDISTDLANALGHSATESMPHRKLESTIAEVVASFADDVVKVDGDANASVAYRRELVRVLGAQEIERSYRMSLRESAL